MTEELKEIKIYTDGACSGNPGPGGYGAILVYGDKRRELSGGFRSTTNNRMEMMAAIVALEALKTPCQVTLYSDSKYLVDSVSKGWAKGWRKNGWRKSNKERAANVDLWERLLALLEKHPTKLLWVEGHAGHPENERCDELAVNAAQESELPEDEGFNNSKKSS